MPPKQSDTGSASKKKSAGQKPEKKIDRPGSSNVTGNPTTESNVTTPIVAKDPITDVRKANSSHEIDSVSEEESLKLANMVKLKVKVTDGKNLRGSKGDHINTFVKIQLGDWESLPSSIANDDPNPVFDSEFSHDFANDEAFIEWMASTKCTVQLYESGGKDKNVLLGTAETPIYSLLFDRPNANDIPRIPVSHLQNRPSSSRPNAQQKSLPPQHSLQVETSIPVSYANPKLLSPDSKPVLNVCLSLSKQLVTPEEYDKANIATLRVGELAGVALPSDWTSSKDDKVSFHLLLQVPATTQNGEGERTVIVPGGSLVQLAPEVVSNYNKKTLQAVYLPKESPLQLLSTCLDVDITNASGNPSTLSSGSTSNASKDGGSAPEEHIGHEASSEQNQSSAIFSSGNTPSADIPATSSLPAADTASISAMPAGGDTAAAENTACPYKLVWNVSHLVYLSEDANRSLRAKLLRKEPLRFEVHRISSTPLTASSQTPGIALASSAAHYGSSNLPFALFTTSNPSVLSGTVDFSKLYFPNVVGIRIAYGANVPSNLPINSPTLNTAPVFLQFSSEQILFEKKELAPISKTVRDLVPRQVRLSDNTAAASTEQNRTGRFITLNDRSAQQALADLRSSIRDTCRTLVKEYSQMPRSESPFARSDNEDARVESSEDLDKEVLAHRKQFYFKLNQSGLYFLLKEKLKADVMQLVRERYARNSPFATALQQQQFLSQIYVDLVDQMHSELNGLLAKPLEFLSSEPSRGKTDYANLFDFALSAELDGRVDTANKYHLERIIKYQSLQSWYIYGCFCLRQGALDRGEECFRQILSRSSTHIPTLLAYGVLCTLRERYDEARVFLHKVVDLRPDYTVGCAALLLFYEIIEDEDRAAITSERLKKAEQLAENAEFEREEDSELAAFFEDSRACGDDEPILKDTYYKLAIFMLHCHASPFVERAVTQLIVGNYPYQHLYLILKRLEIQRGQTKNAFAHVQKAIQADQRNASIWAQLGFLHLLNGQYSKAKAAYTAAYELLDSASGSPGGSWQLPVSQVNMIYQRLGIIYITEAYYGEHGFSRKYLVVPYPAAEKEQELVTKTPVPHANAASVDKALAFFLKAAEHGASSQSWLWVAKALIAKGKYDDAEEALAEANFFNSQDSEVWAYLAIVSLLQNRIYEANQALRQVLDIGLLPDDTLFNTIAVGFLHCKEVQTAVECFKIALEKVPDNDEAKLWLQAINERPDDEKDSLLAVVENHLEPESLRYLPVTDETSNYILTTSANPVKKQQVALTAKTGSKITANSQLTSLTDRLRSV